MLAIASGGGHWTQLMRLCEAFDECEVVYASTLPDHAELVPSARYFVIPDANRWQRLRTLGCLVSVAWLLTRVRPDVVVTTGALPGLLALAVMKTALRRRTIWIDSIANADELSMSGKRAGRFADVWLTQWEHLARPDGPEYAGNVLG